MGMVIVSLYIKLNIMLLITYICWFGIKKLVHLFHSPLSSDKELSLLRVYFSLTLLVPILLSTLGASPLANKLLPGVMLIGPNVSAGIGATLSTNLTFVGQKLPYLVLIIGLLTVGITSQIFNTFKQYRQLQLILKNSILWKNLAGVSILFSQQVTTPFSTRVLGINQIILPYQLIESPRNFRLAVKHELQHIRNGDLKWVLLLDLIKPAFFWNPAFYAWHNEFHCLQEYACDESLIKKSRVNIKAYGNCLLEVANHLSPQKVFASSNMVPKFSLFKSTQSQLKRRILMMTKLQAHKFEKLKISTYSIVMLAALTFSSVKVLEAAETPKESILPIMTVQPKYPAKAISEEIEGWVLLQFTVDTSGNVISPVVLDNCNRSTLTSDTSSADCPKGNLFDSVTLTAISQFKFEPRMVDGSAVEISEVQYLFSFDLEE